MDFLKKLPTPEELRKIYPLSDVFVKSKQKHDKLIKSIFSGEINKFILAIGPCSADREDAVVEYASKLGKIQTEVSDKILLIPRVYTSKPRTIGNGYKGLLHQPIVGRGEDIFSGLKAVRKIHKSVIEESGLFPVDELLYPEIIQYISDLLGYVVVGARSVENQQHRLVSSGINVPVGMKNPVDGNIDVMLNAIETAQNPHHFLFGGWEVISQGNEYTHAVLRGGVSAKGESFPNYSYDYLLEILSKYKARKLENPAFIIDCNHSNSGKKYLKQRDIAIDVLNSMQKNLSIQNVVKGLMVESYLKDGNQDTYGKEYGKSITDPCLGWDKTKELIYLIYEKLDKVFV